MSWIVWIIIILVIYIIFKFLNSANKDKIDLQDQLLDEKFQIVVNTINRAAFNSLGKVTRVNKREFNLFYEVIPNQRIYFVYGTGHLTIIWKYKYFQKEVVHEKTFYDVRNINNDQQKIIGEEMVKNMAQVVENHKIKVTSGLA